MSEKPQTAFVITANRLSDGTVVYLDDQSRWIEQLDGAPSTTHAAERDRLLAFARSCERDVCGPYVIDFTLRPDGTRSLSVRERLRALGAEDARRRLGY